jgi:hypothetical protein
MAGQSNLQHRVRWLTQWLVLSLAANAVLAMALLWSSWQSSGDRCTLELRPGSSLRSSPGLADYLQSMAKISWEGLCAGLKDASPVEFGFCVRDVACARLVHDYGLDLPRALGQSPKQQRVCKVGGETITLFAGMTNADFERLGVLIQKERFPLTPAGCLKRLQRDDTLSQQDRQDLRSTLFASAPWTALEDLFRQGPLRSRDQLFQLVMETGWAPLEPFWEEQRQHRDVSTERRCQFLLSLFDRSNRTAGCWLLEEDPKWVQHRLSDPQVLQLIAMVLPPTPEAKAFLKGILMSPRSDAVRRCAGEKLYALQGEPVPVGMTVLTALQRFCPEVATAMHPHLPARPSQPVASGLRSTLNPVNSSSAKPVASSSAKPVNPSAKPISAHAKAKHLIVEVQKGDNLWKLAKRHKVSIQQIKECNRLDHDRLRVGQTLKIPNS